MVEAYCVKCKAKRTMEKPQDVKLKNGKKAIKGICPKCGTKMFRIGG
jgi:Zn finger protein HypA/HybF involved in hydrogenase expression